LALLLLLLRDDLLNWGNLLLLGVWLGEWLLNLTLWTSATWRDERALQWGVGLVCGEVNKGLLHRLVLQVDGWGSSHRVDGVHLGIVGLFWSAQENVDEGSFSGRSLEPCLDEFLNLVIGNFNVNDLLLSLGSGEPENVLTPQCNSVGVHSIANKFKLAWLNFLTLAFDLEVSAASPTTTTSEPTTSTGVGPAAAALRIGIGTECGSTSLKFRVT